MKKVLAIVFFNMSIFSAIACDCESEESSVELLFYQSSNIFTATVISIENSTMYKQSGNEKYYYEAVTLEINAHYKGDTTKQIVIINEGFSNCGAEFQIGETYLIYPFISSELSRFMVHQCHKPTRLVANVEREITRLQELKNGG